MVWSVLWLLAAIPLGFAIGAWTGARLLVPGSAGLAAGAMVVGYGLLGVLLALVASTVVMRVLDASRRTFSHDDSEPPNQFSGGGSACAGAIDRARSRMSWPPGDWCSRSPNSGTMA